MKVEAVIVGAGRGTRLNKDEPKQFCPIAGKPMLSWTLSRFEKSSLVDSIILVIPQGMRNQVKIKLSLHRYKKIKAVTEGGAQRTDSVYQGLMLVDEDTQIVLVHDGVRPLASCSLIQRVIEETEVYGAVIPGIPVKETIKEKNEYAAVRGTLPRERLCLAQTPQGFRYTLLKEAHQVARSQNSKTSDDASLVEKLHQTVKIIPGEEANIKITTLFDFKIAELLLREEQKNI